MRFILRIMKTKDRRSVWFCSSCNGMADNASLFVKYFGWIGFMFGEKHWNRGAIKCLDTLMEGMVDYQRLGDLQFEEICWNWSCCRFTWQSRRVSEIASRTEQGGCLGYSVLDAGLAFSRRGLVYI